MPTATCVCGRYASDNGQLLVVNKLDQQDFFVNDTWSKGRVTMNLGLRWDRYKGWMPEQSQPAFTNGPVSVPAQTFPARDFYTWNNLGPRIGLTYDLAGDGKTVVKASYGLFWHNPGPGVSADANPNQNNKSVTYTWTDRNGDQALSRWVSSRRTRPRRRWPAPFSSIRTSRSPYSHDASFYLERQVSASIGARVGFVYKTEDDLIAQYNPGRPIEAYTVPYTIVDPGVDGVDQHRRRRHAISLLGVPNTAGRQHALPAHQRDAEHAALLALQDRRSVDEQAPQPTAGRRRSAAATRGRTTSRAPTRTHPERPFDEDNTRWDFKLSGTYEAPYGIRLSPLVRHQAGANFARQFVGRRGAAPPRPARSSAAPINVEPLNSNRHDNITVFDVRVDRGFNLAQRRARARLRRPVQHHEQQLGGDAHDHDRHGVPASDRGARAAHGAHRREGVLVEIIA